MEQPLLSNSAPGYATLSKFSKANGTVNPYRVFNRVDMISILTFFVVIVLQNYLNLAHQRTLYVIEIVATLFFIGLLVSGQHSVYYTPSGIFGLAALVIGGCVGLYCYDSLGYFSVVYSGSRTYQNIVASSPPGSFADAGRIVFSNEAKIDQSNAVGFKAQDGTMYCAAPVRDVSQTGNVGFWAVGWNCCELSGDFNCDAAKSSTAHGGIVVYDNPGFLYKSNKDWYDQARKKAEAQFDLISDDNVIYVRWVEQEDLSMLATYYTKWTWLFIVGCTILYGALNTTFAWVFCKVHYFGFYCKR